MRSGAPEPGPRSEARLNAPPTEAELDLIYVVGVTMSVAARHPVEVTAPLASVAVHGEDGTG